MSKYKQKYLPLIIGVAIATGVFVGGKLNFQIIQIGYLPQTVKKINLTDFIDYIDYEYVDDVNTDSIVDVTVNGILNHLDPHSTYIPEDELQGVNDNMKGEFVGIGINFYPYKDTIAVIRAIKDGPSDKAGIKSGDRIVIANGDSIYGKKWKDEDILNALKGEVNTLLDLKVYRRNEPKLLDFTVKRGNVPLISVDASYMLTNNLGYIKVNRFAESTYKEFKKST